MADVNSALRANHDAIAELIAAADRCEAVWTASPAPGKWSPSQIVEHVALSLMESANRVSGMPSRLPTLPSFLHPLVRAFLFKRVLKKGTFPKSRTNKAMNPASGPATPAEARIRLESALAQFDRACRACASAGGTVASPAFGTVSVEDYARFIEVHTRHHHKQMPGVR
jgi:hypothetical protein